MQTTVAGQWKGGVTALIRASLGPVPIVLRSQRGRGSSKEYGVRVDDDMNNYCAHGTVPVLPETRAIVSALQSEGVRLVATQKAYTYRYMNYFLTGVLDGLGVDKKGRHIAIEWKTGFKRAGARQRRLPPPFNLLYDNQRSRAELQVLTYSHVGKGRVCLSVHPSSSHTRTRSRGTRRAAAGREWHQL